MWSNPYVRQFVIFLGLMAIIAGIVVGVAWLTSSSDYSVPPVVVEHEKNAVLSDQQAKNDLKQADALKGPEAQNQAQIDALKKQIAAAVKDSAVTRQKLSEVESEYEKLRKSPVSIGDVDLDARELRLLAKLRQQQQQ